LFDVGVVRLETRVFWQEVYPLLFLFSIDFWWSSEALDYIFLVSASSSYDKFINKFIIVTNLNR
jgi:hypothetical protein